MPKAYGKCTKKSENEHTVSERIASKLSRNHVGFNTITQQNTQNIISLKKHNPYYDFTYWEDINLNFTTATSPKEVSFSFKHVEGILALDMHYFIKKQLNLFKCTECGKLYTKKRISFYCCSACKNNYRNRLKNECKPWKEYEAIRKRMYSRYHNNYYTRREYTDIMKIFNHILDSYFAGKIDTISALNQLSEKSQNIDNDFKYDLNYGELKQKERKDSVTSPKTRRN